MVERGLRWFGSRGLRSGGDATSSRQCAAHVRSGTTVPLPRTKGGNSAYLVELQVVLE